MRSLLYIWMLLPLGLFAQNVRPYEPVAMNTRPQAVAPPDTKPVAQGVIKVRRPVIRPYFKCEYYLTLASVKMVEIEVTGPDGYPLRKPVPVFDSSYSSANERVYPQKDNHFSRQLVDTIDFAYSFEDTAKCDTMLVEMWIGTNGKVKWKDTAYTDDMPAELRAELYTYAMSISDWGQGGGFKEPKKFMRKQRRMAENYYCMLYIIASSKPLTTEQRHTGMRWAPFDIPLNSPPGDEQQKDFIEGNRAKPGNDSVRRK
jgi:hypothetical protein